MEKSFEAVKITLRERIEFVVVTTGAVEGLGQPNRGCRFHTVRSVFGQEFFGSHTTLLVDHVIAIKPGGHPLFDGSIRQQVAGDLFDGELVEALVVIKRANHPVAPRIQRAVAVHLIAVAVGIAGAIKPIHGHALAVMR